MSPVSVRESRSAVALLALLLVAMGVSFGCACGIDFKDLLRRGRTCIDQKDDLSRIMWLLKEWKNVPKERRDDLLRKIGLFTSNFVLVDTDARKVDRTRVRPGTTVELFASEIDNAAVVDAVDAIGDPAPHDWLDTLYARVVRPRSVPAGSLSAQFEFVDVDTALGMNDVVSPGGPWIPFANDVDPSDGFDASFHVPASPASMGYVVRIGVSRDSDVLYGFALLTAHVDTLAHQTSDGSGFGAASQDFSDAPSFGSRC